MTPNASTKDGRRVRAFNPLSRNERLLFEVLLVGDHALAGFTNRDLPQHLARTPYPLASQAEKATWSLSGRRTTTTAIKLREVAYPSLFATAA